ncbi:MAG: hypothetical protein R2815_00050 [Flavobacteriales bacterium]
MSELFGDLDLQELFRALYAAKDEAKVQEILDKYPDRFAASHWKPLGGNKSNFSIVKNQQSNPIAPGCISPYSFSKAVRLNCSTMAHAQRPACLEGHTASSTGVVERWCTATGPIRRGAP